MMEMCQKNVFFGAYFFAKITGKEEVLYVKRIM